MQPPCGNAFQMHSVIVARPPYQVGRMPSEFDDVLAGPAAHLQHIAGFTIEELTKHRPNWLVIAMESRSIQPAVLPRALANVAKLADEPHHGFRVAPGSPNVTPSTDPAGRAGESSSRRGGGTTGCRYKRTELESRARRTPTPGSWRPGFCARFACPDTSSWRHRCRCSRARSACRRRVPYAAPRPE